MIYHDNKVGTSYILCIHGIGSDHEFRPCLRALPARQRFSLFLGVFRTGSSGLFVLSVPGGQEVNVEISPADTCCRFDLTYCNTKHMRMHIVAHAGKHYSIILDP